MNDRSRMAAMISSSPLPQFGQVCMSDVEHALEQPRPADTVRHRLGRLELALRGRSGSGGRPLLLERPLRHGYPKGALRSPWPPVAA